MVVGLKAPASCWLLVGGCSQILESTCTFLSPGLCGHGCLLHHASQIGMGSYHVCHILLKAGVRSFLYSRGGGGFYWSLLRPHLVGALVLCSQACFFYCLTSLRSNLCSFSCFLGISREPVSSRSQRALLKRCLMGLLCLVFHLNLINSKLLLLQHTAFSKCTAFFRETPLGTLAWWSKGGWVRKVCRRGFSKESKQNGSNFWESIGFLQPSPHSFS